MPPPSPRQLPARMRRLVRDGRRDPVLRHAAALARARSLPLYLVGGAVRDALLGGAPGGDYDLLVPRGAAELARALADAVGGAFIPLDRERGVARVARRGGSGFYDVSDFQRPTLEADLRARDFTINAMALELVEEGSEAVLLDPTGGLEDLRRGLVRAPSASVLDDDPLRLLRAFRFVAALGFALDEATAAAIASRSARIVEPAGERVRDELYRILAVERCHPVVARMAECGLLAALLPELDALRGLVQGPFHHLDAYGHSLLALETVETAALPAADLARDYLQAVVGGGRRRRELLKLGALLHDVGKTVTRDVDPVDGRIRYPGHDRAGARLVDATAERLRLSRAEQKRLHGMVRWHLRPLEMPPPETLSGAEIHRYFRETGGAGPETVVLALADSAASRGPANTAEVRQALQRRAALMLEWYFGAGRAAAEPLLDGHEVARRLGLAPGPELGRVLESLREAQADGRVRTREEAETFLSTLST